MRRILVDKNASSHLNNVIAIADVLGARFDVRIEKPEKLVEQHVQEQAKQLVQMVQGSMALEAQGITIPNDLGELVEVAAAEIRKKPRKQLWARKSHSVDRSKAKPPSPIGDPR